MEKSCCAQMQLIDISMENEVSFHFLDENISWLKTKFSFFFLSKTKEFFEEHGHIPI